MKKKTSATKPIDPSVEKPEEFDDPAWANIPTPGRPHPFSKQRANCKILVRQEEVATLNTGL